MRTREVRGFVSSDWRTQCFVGCIMCHPGGWCWGPFLYPDQNNLVSHGLKGLGKEEGMTHAGQQPLGSAFLYLAITGIVSMQQHGTPLFTGFYGTRMNTGCGWLHDKHFPSWTRPICLPVILGEWTKTEFLLEDLNLRILCFSQSKFEIRSAGLSL